MTIEKRFNPREDTPSEVVIQAVAQAEETSVENLHPPLYDDIDLDAVDALMSHNAQGVQVSFERDGYRITVDKIGEQGKITVSDYFLHASDEPQSQEEASQTEVEAAISEVDTEDSSFSWKNLF